jgi:hypothetical protein
MTKQSAKEYKPRRTPGSLDDVVYPETRAKIEAAKMDEKDMKDREAIKGMGYAKGGVTRADGCCAKGHTKGTMVKMASGGKTC